MIRWWHFGAPKNGMEMEMVEVLLIFLMTQRFVGIFSYFIGTKLSNIELYTSINSISILLYIYNSHTTYFVLASIFLSFFLKFPSSNSKQPVVMLRVFYRRGLVRNNETGHEAGTCSLFVTLLRCVFVLNGKKYTTPKTVVMGCLK